MALIAPYNGPTGSIFQYVTTIIGLAAAISSNSNGETNLPVFTNNGNGGGNGGGGGGAGGDITGLNNHPSVSNTPLLKKAVLDQSQMIFNNNPEIPGQCGQYSYNIVYKVKQHIENNQSTAIVHSLASSGGNADQNGHRQGLKNLGLFDEYYIGEFTGAQLKSPSGPIKSRSWNYGDVVNYYAPCCSGTSYMHTQTYTGDIWQKGINGKGQKNATGNSGWSTSGKTNYGTFFVYPGDNKIYKVYVYKVKAQYLK